MQCFCVLLCLKAPLYRFVADTLSLNLRSRCPGPEADLEVHRPGPGRPVVRPPPLPRQGLGRAAPEDAAHHDRLGGVRPLHHGGWCLELETNPREV